MSDKKPIPQPQKSPEPKPTKTTDRREHFEKGAFDKGPAPIVQVKPTPPKK